MNNTLNKTKSNTGLQFHPSQLIAHMPNFVFWKDEDGVFQGCNDNFANALGLESPADIIGKTDRDFAWDNESAQQHQTIHQLISDHDKLPQANETFSHSIEDKHQVIGSKTPLFNHQGHYIGVISHYDIQKANQASNNILSQITPENMDNLFRHVQGKHCKLTINGSEVLLNRKESECLLYIIKGLTAKAFAKCIARSSRTAEYYVNQLRKKLQSDKKSQLATVAVEAGFLENFTQ